jgi:hypothetical protein
VYEVVLPHFAGSSNIYQAVEDQAKAKLCSDFETVQRSGTCYYKSVLAAIRYLGDKMVGLSKVQRKQLMCALRFNYLKLVDDELDILALSMLAPYRF